MIVMALQCVMKCKPSTTETVFNFPIAKAKREKWLIGLNLDVNYEFEGPTGVCERHFNPTHLKKVGLISLLALNAVPDLCVRGPIPFSTHIKKGGNKIVSNASTTVKHVTYPTKTKNIPIQLSSNSCPVVLKMEIDEKPPSISNQLETLEIPIALPMIEPDSIKIEVEKLECNVPDPLDPYLDRIHDIQNRHKGNAELQAKMKEFKTKIREEKKKVKQLKRNLYRHSRSYDKLNDEDKRYNEDIMKISKLRNIYLNPEMKIPRLIYDRFGMIEFDGLKYPNDLKQFAIELYSKSPTAYDYVRENLCNVIPHPDAILRWTKPQVIAENED